MKLELKAEIEASLLAQAHARGLSLEAYVDEVLVQAAHQPAGAPANLLDASARPPAGDPPIWEVITDIMKDVPDEIFDRLPKDGASQIDHYLYGVPKRS